MRPVADHTRAHAALLNAVLIALGAHPKLRLWRQNSGLFEIVGTDRKVRAIPEGSPDIAGVLSGGRLVGWEIKTGTGRPNPAQVVRLTVLREFGALAGVVRSVEQAVSAVDAALRGEWKPGPGLEL